MGYVGQVIDRKNQDSGKTPRFLLVLVGILSNILNDFAVAIGYSNFALNISGRKLPLIF